MNHIRLLTNAVIHAQYKTGDKHLKVPSGRFLPVQKLVENPDNTVTAYLQDGGIVHSLDKSCFSVQGQLVYEKATTHEGAQREPPTPVLTHNEPALSIPDELPAPFSPALSDEDFEQTVDDE